MQPLKIAGLVSLLAACSAPSEEASDQAATSKARVTFHIPLQTEDGVLLSKFNPQLKAAGLDTFPDFILADETFDYKTWEAWGEKVEKASRILGDAMLYGSSPETFGKGFCYEGDGTKVGLLSEALAGSIFTEQFTLIGWKYKQKQYVSADYETPTASLWKSWRGTGEAALLVFSVGDGGDDRNTSIVYRCKGDAPDTTPTPMSDVDFSKAVAKATKDLTLMSEADYPYWFTSAERTKKGAFSAAEVKALFSKTIAKELVLEPDEVAPSFADSEVMTGEAWFSGFNPDDVDDDQRADEQRSVDLGKLLTDNLSNFKAYRFGSRHAGALGPQVIIVLVGTLPSGTAVALYSVAIET